MLADETVAAKSVIVSWAMGLTQHRNSVATLREIDELPVVFGAISAVWVRDRAPYADTATSKAIGRWDMGADAGRILG